MLLHHEVDCNDGVRPTILHNKAPIPIIRRKAFLFVKGSGQNLLPCKYWVTPVSCQTSQVLGLLPEARALGMMHGWTVLCLFPNTWFSFKPPNQVAIRCMLNETFLQQQSIQKHGSTHDSPKDLLRQSTLSL